MYVLFEKTYVVLKWTLIQLTNWIWKFRLINHKQTPKLISIIDVWTIWKDIYAVLKLKLIKQYSLDMIE